MATINAVLYHKMFYFFWVGFYFPYNNKLSIGPYQGPLACQELEYPKGVCWKSVMCKHNIIVKNVHEFTDHIACDSRSKSEIGIPMLTKNNDFAGVFDVDSDKYDSFDEHDEKGLQIILSLLND